MLTPNPVPGPHTAIILLGIFSTLLIFTNSVSLIFKIP